MKKIVLVPDSFKGTMSSIEICAILSSEIISFFPNCEIISLPVADGGEGTVDCFLQAIEGKKISATVCDAYLDEITSFFAVINDGKTAIIEMAACAGLPMIKIKNPSKTSTYGVGQLIKKAMEYGCNEIIVGLGGSSTNDGGCGCVNALGVRFYDSDMKEFLPVGGTLKNIASIDCSAVNMGDVNIKIMCDINNPLYGEKGAAYIFGPQKGATPTMVKELDDNLIHFASLIDTPTCKISELAGAGAAGGMGAGMVAFLGGVLHSGIDIVLDTVDFENVIADADLIITGEGRIDSQSIGGKVVAGVASRSGKIPTVAIVGDILDPIDDIYLMGLDAVLSINRMAIPFSQAKRHCREDLAHTVNTLMRLMKI